MQTLNEFEINDITFDMSPRNLPLCVCWKLQTSSVFFVSQLMGAGVDSEYSVHEVPALYNWVQFSWKSSSHVTLLENLPTHTTAPIALSSLS